MEAVLDTYHRQPQAGEVRLCLDERPCQLLEEVRVELQQFTGGFLLGSYVIFKVKSFQVAGSAISQGRMSSFPVIPPFDIFKNGQPGLLPGDKFSVVDQLSF
jgi:hypothetical protein